MYPEKRKEDRSNLTRQPQGKLQVLVGDRSHHVFEVMDVSPMGIRLKIDSQVGIGENVQIRYQTKEVDLKLNGTVIWNSDSPTNPGSDANPGSCIIGIQLTSPSLLHAFW